MNLVRGFTTGIYASEHALRERATALLRNVTYLASLQNSVSFARCRQARQANSPVRRMNALSQKLNNDSWADSRSDGSASARENPGEVEAHVEILPYRGVG